MNRIHSFFSREYGISNDQTYDFALRRLCVAKEDSWRGILPSNYSSDYNPEPPIFSAKFANCEGYRHILAIANEDGKIALQDTTQRNLESEERALNAPQCHYNAVFDLEWAPNQMKFVSASGDHTAQLWEVDGAEIRSVRSFVGHTRSVKTAAFRKCDSSVFATGGRDGAIIIWDTRAHLNVDRTPRADNCIFSGHAGGPATPVSQRKRTRTPKMTPSTTSSSITGLAFQDSNTLISCGAGDGVIKVWDLRRNYTAYKKEPHPKYSLPYAGSSTFKGFTNLLIDSSGTRLYANCMDNSIYCYNLFSYSPKPMATYKGLLNSTFYIKSCLSPDGKYLLSGSSDEKAYIWNLNYPEEPLVSLMGHTVEVTCVAWGATHDFPIVTCSDDARHKIWRIGPEEISDSDRTELYRGQAEYVRQFQKKAPRSTHKYNLRDLESTPRSLRRLVDQNERTPGSMEKVSAKRSFLEMLGGVSGNDFVSTEPELKRPKILESRGRRLFSPSKNSASTSRCLSLQLTAIPEERQPLQASGSSVDTSPLSRNQTTSIESIESNQENAATPQPCVSSKSLHANHSNHCTPSPLSERTALENHNQSFVSPPAGAVLASGSSSTATSTLSAIIFSPTSNLPNYVLDGDAPHLSVMSPKRKHKDKVDWLTKIRKQKLMTSCRSPTFNSHALAEKFTEQHGCDAPSGVLSSPRLQSIRNDEGSPRLRTTPRRRTSHTGHLHDPSSPTTTHHPRTPTSSRRNSETSILRFFSVSSSQQQQQQHEQEQQRRLDEEEEEAEMDSERGATNSLASESPTIDGALQTDVDSFVDATSASTSTLALHTATPTPMPTPPPPATTTAVAVTTCAE